MPDIEFLGQLEKIVRARMQDDPESSYTARLIDSGVPRIAQKVGEEAVEVALAAAAGNREDLVAEAADLLYHLIVLLNARQLSLADVADALARRHAG